MDTFWNILLLLVFAIIFISKKKIEKKRVEDQENPKPIFTPTPIWMTSKETEESEYQEDERYVTEEKRPMTLKEELEATRSQTNVTKKYENVMEDVHSPSEVTVNEPIMEDFDLRKAVIYSEILKPKFDE